MDGFTPVGMRNPEDHRGRDRWVVDDDLFHLARIDVVAAGDDDVLCPVEQVEVTLVVEEADIAGVQPTVSQGLGRGFRVVPIARHHYFAAGDDFTDFALRKLTVVAIDDPNFDIGSDRSC